MLMQGWDPRSQCLAFARSCLGVDTTNRPGVQFGYCRCVGGFRAAGTAVATQATPYVAERMRQLVFTSKGMLRGKHVWSWRIDSIPDSLNLEVRVVVGVASQGFQMGTRNRAQRGAACLVSHAGYVYGTNGFAGNGYDIRFGEDDTVVSWG